jgi:hypothetical protein
MKSLIQGFLTGMRGQARVLAPRQVTSPRFSRHLNTPREISPLWERIPVWGFKSPLGLEPLHLTVTATLRTRWSQGYLTRPERRRSAGPGAGGQRLQELSTQSRADDGRRLPGGGEFCAVPELIIGELPAGFIA